jgi:hypothetical protein
MLKELESRKTDFTATDIPTSAETTNSLPMGTTSPMSKITAHSVKVGK